jgi:hypothetical protein
MRGLWDRAILHRWAAGLRENRSAWKISSRAAGVTFAGGAILI